jgi:hypothetical protein
VPLGLHQVNHIISSKARFAHCADHVVTDVPSLIDLLSCLGDDGRRVISVPVNEWHECEIADTSCWKSQDVAGQSLQYLLESLFLLDKGASAYEAHWSGRCWERDSERSTALLSDVLADLQLLQPYLNNCPSAPCIPKKTFEDARAEVISDEAAFVVTADWNLLTGAGASEKAEHGPFPGTRGTYLFTTDSFALPSLPDTSGEAGLRWVDILLQPEVQLEFARPRGAYPALGDHSQLPALLPSLEVLLPPNIDPRALRRQLNDWAQGNFESPPPSLQDLVAEQFVAARSLGILPAAAPDSPACGAP